ncbi:hypothetical protein GJ496_009854, partial [Pomphorhynchus laevis]
VLSSNGLLASIYFILVILFGAFYLINLTIAIVSSSYEEQQTRAILIKQKLDEERIIKKDSYDDECMCSMDIIINNWKDYAIYKQIFKLECLKRFPSIRAIARKIILDPFADLTIMFCIVTNTVFLALDFPDQGKLMLSILNRGNLQNLCNDHCYVLCASQIYFICCKVFYASSVSLNFHFSCSLYTKNSRKSRMKITDENLRGKSRWKYIVILTFIFMLECILKMLAITPDEYFRQSKNVFDFIIVFISLAELVINSGVKGISIFRSFRLLRIFKLAKSWPTLNRLLYVIGNTLSALGNLSIALVIIIFIFAVIGMQLFGPKYREASDRFPDGIIPRWNFIDFFHSFMIVFRVLCGEYMESMWNCLLVAGWPCIPFFLLTMTIGNLVALNIILALLINAFSGDVLKEKDDEINNINEAFNRIKRCFALTKQYISSRVMCLNLFRINYFQRQRRNNQDKFSRNTFKKRSCAFFKDQSPMHVSTQIVKQVDIEAGHSILYLMETYPIDKINKKSKGINRLYMHFEDGLNRVLKVVITPARRRVAKFIDHRYFEMFIILMICLSTISLAMDDINARKNIKLSEIIGLMDKCFTIVFIMEMFLNWFAYGLIEYFRSPWNVIDALIVLIGVLSIIASFVDIANVKAFKSLRTLRALRPLRAMSRFEGIKVVINALIGAIFAIFNVLVVCIVFWLIFSIMGVQLLGGRFYKCVYPNTHERVHIDIVQTKNDCLSLNYTWENSRINFDNIINGYLALLQVATYKGWMEIMYDAVDSRGIDLQPSYEHNVYIYCYFVLFIILGSFFTLKLFIGVVIDNFNQQKAKLGGASVTVLMTEQQKMYYNAMKKMGKRKPIKALPRPKIPAIRIIFEIVSNQRFDVAIIILIMLNTLSMCIEHYAISKKTVLFLNGLNMFFLTMFTIECLLKILAFNIHYLKSPWNVFDMFVILISIAGEAMGEVVKKYFVNPTLLRVIRIVRICRVLRLVRAARGVRTLLFALLISLPALFNIGLLLFLVMFIYGILAGWADVLKALSNHKPPDCDPTLKNPSGRGDCGNPTIAVPFLVTYLFVSSFLVINMYIAVIMENYNQAREEVQQGLTDDDYDVFYEVWQKYDPKGTQFVQYHQLTEILDKLQRPLRIAAPNYLKIVLLNIPIYEDYTINCNDLLDALTRSVLNTSEVVDNNDGSSGERGTGGTIELRGKNQKKILTNTLELQKKAYYGKVILRTLRNNVQRKAKKENPSPLPPNINNAAIGCVDNENRTLLPSSEIIQFSNKFIATVDV